MHYPEDVLVAAFPETSVCTCIPEPKQSIAAHLARPSPVNSLILWVMIVWSPDLRCKIERPSAKCVCCARPWLQSLQDRFPVVLGASSKPTCCGGVAAAWLVCTFRLAVLYGMAPCFGTGPLQLQVQFPTLGCSQQWHGPEWLR